MCLLNVSFEQFIKKRSDLCTISLSSNYKKMHFSEEYNDPEIPYNIFKEKQEVINYFDFPDM